MPAVPDFDHQFARRQFPAFDDPELRAWVYADNAGGSFMCGQVIDRLARFHTSTKFQGGYANAMSDRSAQAQAEGPARLAPWLGVDEDWMHVGPSTTQNTYVLAHAFGQTLRPGDAIVVTDQDHEANTGSWRRLADRGVEVREWRVDPTTGSLATADLEDLLDGTVRVVAFPHASNILGEVNPVAAWCDLVREAGAVSVVDGVAMAPHGLPDVAALGADVWLFSTYKTFGPHQGVMLVRPEVAQSLPNQGHFFNEGILAKRLVPAGPDHAQVAALAGIADYLDALFDHHAASDVSDRGEFVRSLFRNHEAAVVTALLDFLEGRDDVRVLGPTDPQDRVPTVSFVGPRPAGELVAALGEHRVMAGAGHFYAHRLLGAMGLDQAEGCVRLSLLHTTRPQDVTQILRALDTVLA